MNSKKNGIFKIERVTTVAKSIGLIIVAALGAGSQVWAQDAPLPAFSWDAPLPALGVDFQEPLPPPPVLPPPQAPPSAPPRRPHGRDDDLTLNVGVHGRYSLIFGAADREVISYGGGYYGVSSYVGWEDLFHPGWGVDLEVDLMLGDAQKRGHNGFDYGGCLVFSQDQYGGGSESDGFGNSIQVSDLTMSTIMVGGKVINTFENGFFADGRFVMGAVHYSAVEADFRGPLVPLFHDEFLEDTWTFGMDIHGHGGIRLGPLAIVIGMGFRFMLPPNEGGRVDLDSGAVWTWDIDLGVELGF